MENDRTEAILREELRQFFTQHHAVFEEQLRLEAKTWLQRHAEAWYVSIVDKDLRTKKAQMLTETAARYQQAFDDALRTLLDDQRVLDQMIQRLLREAVADKINEAIQWQLPNILEQIDITAAIRDAFRQL